MTLLSSASAPANNPADTRAAPEPLRAALTVSALLIVALMAAAAVQPKSGYEITDYLYIRQDALVLAGFAALYLAAIHAPLPQSWAGPWALARHSRRARSRLAALLIGGAVFAAYFGTRLALSNFALSRDEDMAEFDARILQSGRLIAPLAAEWRPLFDALGTVFMFDIPGRGGWMSAYYPGNAALRAFFGALGDRALTGPAMTLTTLLSVYAIAGKLWPGRGDARLVAAALLALSPQVVITAMTPYAMSAHLALNSLWLLLFLRGGWLGHAGAIAAGMAATGLHQIVFHPLFAAPFIFQLWFQNRRGTAIVYAAAYGVIGLFWAQYFQMAMRLEGFGAAAAGEGGIGALLERVALVIANFDPAGLCAMERNLLRLIGWQHLLMLPLAAAGCAALRGADPVLRSLAAGLALTTAAAWLLMPFQGNGWGYRYPHGLLVNAALLAAWGWISISGKLSGAGAARAGALFTAAGALSLFALMPLRLWQAREFTQPFVNASEFIEHSGYDVVLLDPGGHRLTVDLVRNDPFLGNRPLRMEIWQFDAAGARALCGRFRVGIFDARHSAAFGFPAFEVGAGGDAALARARALFSDIGCGTPLDMPALK